ncbi:hypothetical protein J6590_044697 [Homalodisca vitripennis]|nr:hypothetical protein J6590_044697 [Homalodisca vitripennis]
MWREGPRSSSRPVPRRWNPSHSSTRGFSCRTLKWMDWHADSYTRRMNRFLQGRYKD